MSVIDLADYKIHLLQFFDNYSYKELTKKLVDFNPNEVIFNKHELNLIFKLRKKLYLDPSVESESQDRRLKKAAG